MKEKNNKKLPEIIIKYNKLLDPILLTYAKNDPEWKDAYSQEKWSPWPKDKLLKNIEECKTKWEKYEKSILVEMCDILGLEFYRNVINVHIVSANPRSFSSPLIIRGTFPPSTFIESLTHELVHELCTYGIDYESNNALYFKILREIFPNNENSLTINHTLVYAVLEYLFIDILDDTKLWKISTEKALRSNNDYSIAYNLTKELGYKKLLQKFKHKHNVYKNGLH